MVLPDCDVSQHRMTLFQKTYEMVDGPPAMDWGAYQALVRRAWNALLDSGARDEREYQQFLERHPCMVPGPFGLIGTSGHSPYPSAIISQPVLPDFTRRIPDFMWIARDSETIYPVLIEIESPSKPWFTKGDKQHAKLTQALHQITEWKAWFQNPLNVARLRDYYELEVRGESIRPLYLLIYGRRAEANKTVERQRLRSNMSRDDEFLMTYDRLVPQAGASEFYTVRVDRSGYHALYVPATSTIGPLFAHERATIRDKDIAVSNSPYFSADRQAFYLSRLPYWDDWAVNGRRGIIYTGDRE
jgi:hypothetical protein